MWFTNKKSTARFENLHCLLKLKVEYELICWHGIMGTFSKPVFADQAVLYERKNNKERGGEKECLVCVYPAVSQPPAHI